MVLGNRLWVSLLEQVGVDQMTSKLNCAVMLHNYVSLLKPGKSSLCSNNTKPMAGCLQLMRTQQEQHFHSCCHTTLG